MRSRQAELIKRLTDQQLNQQLFLSQFVLLGIGLLVGFILFDSVAEWTSLFSWTGKDVILLACLPAVLIVFVDILLTYVLPRQWMNDDGINERIFKNQTVPQIIIICMFVAVSEELLFRGIIQTHTGLYFASIFFALIHVRYLTKPVLFSSILVISFYLGYIYDVTNNLVIPIIAHFLIDFFLAIFIRYRK